MSVQQETAELNLKIDTGASEASIKELNKQIKYLTTSLEDMHKQDNPALYTSRIAQVQNLIGVRNAERKTIFENTAAIEAERKAIEAEKAARDARKQAILEDIAKKETEKKALMEQIALQKKMNQEYTALYEQIRKQSGQGPVAGLFSSLQGLSGDDALSRFLSSIQTGYAGIVGAGAAVKEKITAVNSEFLTQKSVLEGLKAEQEAVNAAVAANAALQTELATAYTAAVTEEEAQIIVLEELKAQEEGVALATAANTVALELQTVAANTSSVAMRVLKIALASTGIGLLIVAITSLIAYFGETNEGSKKLKVIWAELNAVFQQTMKLLAPIGKAIFDAFSTSGVDFFKAALLAVLIPLRTIIEVLSDLAHANFKEAFIDLGKGVTDAVTNQVNGFKAGIQLTKDLAVNLVKAGDEIKKNNTGFANAALAAKAFTEERQKMTIAEREWSTEKLKQEGQVALMIKKLRDQNLTEAERITIAENAKKVRDQIYKSDLAFAKQNEDLVNREQALNSKKDLQAIADARNRVQQVTNAYLSQSQIIENKESGLQKKLGGTKDAKARFNNSSNALTGEFKSFNDVELADTMAKNDKEIQAAQNKYDALIAKEKEFIEKSKTNKFANEAEIQKHRDEITALELGKQTAVYNIKARQEKELVDTITAFRDHMNGKLEDESAKEIAIVNEKYDKLKADAGKNGDELAQIEEARAVALADVKVREEKRFQDEKRKLEEDGLVNAGDKDAQDLARINKKYDDELKALKDKFSAEFQATQQFKALVAAVEANRDRDLKKAADDKAKKDASEKKLFAVQSAQDVSNAYFSIAARNRQADSDAQIKKLEDQKTVELSNKNLTEAQKTAINAKYAKQEAEVKRKAFEAQKAADIEQAIINGALAVTKALAQTGILGSFVIPGIIVATAAQVATIATQKTPTFAEGGVPDGPSHAQGGMKLVGPYGQIFGEIEGGEPVLSRQTYANNRSVVDALLNSGGGQVNYDRVAEATANREARRSFTATATAGPSAGVASNTGSQNSTSDRMAQMESMMLRLIQVQSQMQKTPVVFSRRVQENEDARLGQIKNEVNA